MSYQDGEEALLTVIQDIAGFSVANTSRGKWGILNSGTSDHYVVVRQGGWTAEYTTLRTLQTVYRTVVEVWKRYKDDQTTYIELVEHVNDLKVGIEPERLLGGLSGVVDASVKEGSEPAEMWKKGGGPAWLKQEFIVEWLYQTDVTFTD
jgi:hypothetical protein